MTPIDTLPLRAAAFDAGFSLMLARVGAEIARAELERAKATGCTQAIKAAQDASKQATHALMAAGG